MNMTNMYILDRDYREEKEAKGSITGIDLGTEVQQAQAKVREATFELKKIFDHENSITKIEALKKY